MRYAISAPNVGAPSDLVALAVAAEEAGWDGFFLWDHLHLRREGRWDVHDPWVLFGAMAHATERVVLGPLVTPLARRRPWKLAKEVVTLDHLSHGRAMLGVGLGTPPDDEFGAFGESTDARVRADRLDEGLEVVAGLLTGERFTHVGAHYTVDAEFHPRPAQRPRPPIWVAGFWPNRRPLQRAARWDGVVPLQDDGTGIRPEVLADVLAVTGTRPGFDVVASWWPDTDPADYAAAGATWLVDSRPPWLDGWHAELDGVIRAGPPSF